MLDYLDLIELCRRTEDFSLSNVLIHGMLRDELQTTGLLAPNVNIDSNLACHRFDILAITLDNKYKGYLQNFGLSAKNNIYLAKGSMSIFIDKRKALPLNDWYTVKGKVRLSKRSDLDGIIGMYTFYKFQGCTTWSIAETQISDFSDDVCLSSSDRVRDCVAKSVRAGKVIYPDVMDDIQPCKCDKLSLIFDDFSK